MAHFGTIKTYDSDKGEGAITPEKGGDALFFAKGNLQKQDMTPRADQRFSYEVQNDKQGKAQAVKLEQA